MEAAIDYMKKECNVQKGLLMVRSNSVFAYECTQGRLGQYPNAW